MAFKDGDFLEIEYSAWNTVDNSLLASTDEKRAKDAGIYNSNVRYGPMLVVLGANAIVKGLERELKGMSIGEEKSFTLRPEDAFGKRREELVRVMPMSEFRTHDINPQPGMRVNIDNVVATVRSVSSGRVVIDANHPDAGKEIKYTTKVVRELIDNIDKAKALANTYDLRPTNTILKDGVLELFFDSNVKKNADYFVNKAGALAAIFTYLKDIKKANVHEEYSPESVKEETKAEAQDKPA